MELTIDQALQKAIEAHKASQVQEADRLYTAILKAQPKHPDANHNIGILNVGLSKVQKALPFFKIASKANPSIAQYWLSYIDALIKLDQIADAKAVFDQAKSHGAKGDGFDELEKQIKGMVPIGGITSTMQNPPQDQLQTLINLYSQRQFQQALDTASQLLIQFPKSVILHNICGAVNAGLGSLDSAVESYKQAINIKPDYAEAYNNMGVTLQDQGKLEEAIEAYNKALAIKPDYADAYYNMGNALKEQGKLEEAIEAYNKVVVIKPDNAEAWNNIVFALQALKAQVSSRKELVFRYPKDTGSQSYKMAKSILTFRLDQGTENAVSSLTETLELIANNDNLIIKNPFGSKTSNVLEPLLPNKVIALTHFGRSGTGLLHSLIDGHPDISNLPSIYFSEYFDHSTWEKIIAGGWSEMAGRFVSIYEVLFDASSNVPIETKSKQLIYNIGRQEGMANVGDQRNEILSVDKVLFCSELKELMEYFGELDAFIFFKLAQAAYDKAIHDINQKSLIFYHIHNPDTYALLNFVRCAPTAEWIMMVREPIQSCESWIRNKFLEEDYSSLSKNIVTMLFAVDDIIYYKQRSIGVRLEDLKETPRTTIPALCKWMGIVETESLYEMTAQGKKWWGDPTSPDFEKDGMEPFGQTSIKRKVGSIFSENDQFILRTLFYPFSVRFGYVEEKVEQFKVDLQAIRSMLEQMFDFERVIIERTQADPEQFMKSGSYLYLRSGLIERWNTLNEHHTYPNMIKRLNIN